MEGNAPGDQLDDLRLTIELQDLRRQYQDTYAPPPMIILSDIENTIRAPEYTALIMREPTRPANVTFELIVARAQQTLVDGDYSETERLVSVLQNILETETFEVPLAADYFAITTLLLAEGFDVDDLVIQDDRTAQAVVLTNGLEQQRLQLQKNANEWEITP